MSSEKESVANTAKGEVSVLPKYVGEIASGDPARHFRLLVKYRYMIVSLVI